jgi:hypothetical protein
MSFIVGTGGRLVLWEMDCQPGTEEGCECACVLASRIIFDESRTGKQFSAFVPVSWFDPQNRPRQRPRGRDRATPPARPKSR